MSNEDTRARLRELRSDVREGVVTSATAEALRLLIDIVAAVPVIPVAAPEPPAEPEVIAVPVAEPEPEPTVIRSKKKRR